MSTTRAFAVPAPGKAAWMFILGVGILLPMAVVLVALAFNSGGSQRQSVAAGTVAVGLLVGIGLIGLMRRRAIELHGDTLVVKAAMYTRRTPLAAIDLDAARTLDLREHTELKTRWKTNGYAVPGFHAGLFSLRDGRRAFLLVTSPRVVVLPVPGDRTLLLSSEQPAALLAALRSAAGSDSDRRRARASADAA